MRVTLIPILLGIAWLVGGCQLTPTFDVTYQVDRTALRATPLPGSLAVRRFEDARPPRAYATAGRTFLLYIPLLPYVSLDYERLEESIRIQSEAIEQSGRGITLGAEQKPAGDFETYSYPASFARAIAKDLEASGLFAACHYVGTDEPTSERYVLSGTIHETPLTRSATSYMLGMAGVLLWMLPIPMERTHADVSVALVLTDRETGETVWQRTLHSEVSRLITLYTSSAMVYGRSGAFSFNLEPPPSDSRVDRHSLFSWHFEALRRAMLDARQDLAKTLATRTAMH